MSLVPAARAADGAREPRGVTSSGGSSPIARDSLAAAERPSPAGAPPRMLAGDPLAGTLARAVRDRRDARISGAAGGDRILQRLMTSKDFTKTTDLTLAGRGKTLKEIDRLLARANTSSGRNDPQLLFELVEVTQFWLDSHEHDTSRSRHREPAIRRVQEQARLALLRLAASRPQGAVPLAQSAPSAFVRTMQGDASSALTKLAGPIDAAIPLPGDAVSGEVDVKIPLDQSGTSYLGFRISLAAARMDNKATSLSCEIALTGGAQLAGIADVGGEIGLALTAQGKTPAQALKLISYGWYRVFRESPIIPREVANLMWGGSATAVGWARSEQWAANIEKRAFSRKDGDVPLSSGVGSAATTNEFVRIGAISGLSAEVNLAEVVTLEAGVSSGVGTHYDQTSVKAGKRRYGKAVGEALPMPARGRSQALGTAYTSVGGNLGASAGPFSGSLSFSVTLMGREQQAKKRDRRIPEGYVSVSGSLGATVPMCPSLAPVVVNAMKTLAPKMARFLKVIDAKSSGTLGENALGAAETTLLTALSDLPDVVAAAGSLVSLPRPTALSLTMNAGYEMGAGAGGWTFDISVAQESGLGFSAGVVGLSLSKSSRLLRIILAKDGRWKLSVD